MKKNEKLAYLIHNHFDLFVETHLRAYNDLSEKQEVFCCCGRVATYSHEVHCKDFGAKVENETIKRLRHLLPKE